MISILRGTPLRGFARSAGSILPMGAMLLVLGAAVSKSSAQSLPGLVVPPAPQQIAGPINERALATLAGNARAKAWANLDRGRVPDSLPQSHTLMMLKRSPQREEALHNFMREQYNPRSPNFHRWLTPEQFGELFGPSMADVEQLTRWLVQQGFTINRVAPGRTFIDFSGSAGQIEAAFHTEIHYYQLNGRRHYANTSEPSIPAALAPLVAGFRGLDNFYPHPLSRTSGLARLDRTTGRWSYVSGSGHLTAGTGANAVHLVGPQDFATIYGLNQVWSQTIEAGGQQQKLVGTGQTIGVVGNTDLNVADINGFRSQFGLNTIGPNGSVVVDHPPASVCAAPAPGTNISEGYIDVEWAGATAPDATIDFVACADGGNTAGADLAATYIVEDPAHVAQDAVLSTSWGYCEANPVSESDQFYVSLWQQAAAEGITVVVAAGDAGGAACDEFGGPVYATEGLAVSAEASTPYNVAVGGTDFSDVFSGSSAKYWAPSNGANLESALSYIPETAWNDSCGSPLVLQAFGAGYTSSSGPDGFCTHAAQLPIDPSTAFSPYFNYFAGGGGLSAVSPRPEWQNGVTGIPSGTARALPDISMFASSGVTWGHALLYCDSYYLPSGVTCDFSDPNNLYDNENGGTSFAAPAFAGIMALIDQKSGQRQGQADNILYLLAAQQYLSGGSSSQPNLATCAAYLGSESLSSCYFHDLSGTLNPDPATQAQTPFLIGSTSIPCTGSAIAPGTFTEASPGPNSNSENCNGYQITVAQSGGALTTTPDYYGVLAAADHSPAYSVAPGYDLASGLGSPNAAALVLASAWSPLVIATSSLPAGAVGMAYSQALAASGRVAPYTWSIVSGSLPQGLSLNSSSGTISGTPAAPGISTFTIEVADAESSPATANASFTIAVPGLTVAITPSRLTIPFGGSGMLAITLTPEGGFAGPVDLSCRTPAATLSCSFAPSSPITLTANSGPVTGVVTIHTASLRSASADAGGATGGGSPILAASVLWLPAGLAGLLEVKRKWRSKERSKFLRFSKSRSLWMLTAAVFAAGLLAAAALSGCGGHTANTTPDGSYNVTVTIAYAGGSQTANATVLVE